MWQCIKCETFNADAHTACVVCNMQKRISLARQKEQQAEAQALEQRQKQEQQAEAEAWLTAALNRPVTLEEVSTEFVEVPV